MMKLCHPIGRQNMVDFISIKETLILGQYHPPSKLNINNLFNFFGDVLKYKKLNYDRGTPR